ncbi:MAG: FG-GAP repeat protein, partial [Anaerolineales bacterium]|nr:FG-GAP repeat protein [Anaerolineales bacterium]
DDILIGAPSNQEGGYLKGQSYLILGKDSGWEMDTSLSTADASFFGEDGYDHAGSSVAGIGDVNGDGFDDFLINAPNNEEGAFFAGQSYLVLGKASGWLNDVDLSEVDASFIGEASQDYSGTALAVVGDVNGDGYDAVLIGAQNYDDGENANAGKVYLMLSDYVTPGGAYRRVLPGGDVTAEDFGTTRVEIDFNAGTAGVTDVTLHRSATGDMGAFGAEGYWELSTTKTGFSADITFHYLDSEIAGLNEADLKLYSRESSGDSWNLVPNQTLNMTNNTVHATGMTGFSQFTLATQLPITPPPPVGGISVSVGDDAAIWGGETEQGLGQTTPWGWIGAVVLLAIMGGAVAILGKSQSRRLIK